MRTTVSKAVGVLVCGGFIVACVETVPGGSSSSSSASSSSSSSSSSSGSSGYAAPSSSSSSSGSSYKPECTFDSECAFRDKDDDVCTMAACESGTCVQKLIRGTAECECQDVSDCTSYYGDKPCTALSCDAHKCKKRVLPAGPAPKQTTGDCYDALCDGVAEDATRKFNGTDIGDDKNACTAESCDPTTGSKETNVIDGTSCGDGSVCFQGTCLACKPQNAASCGAEGVGEPMNNTSTTPSPFSQFTPMCTFTSGTDIDWYTFYAKDADFSFDAFNFKLWSTAPTLEVCIYVSCVSGLPDGACANKVAGPNGSLGCCWTGAPSTLAPYWNLDCTGTTEDSGTAYMSVRAPRGGSCEQYAITGGY